MRRLLRGNTTAATSNVPSCSHGPIAAPRDLIVPCPECQSSRRRSAGPSVTVALTAGSLPPGLSLSPPFGSGAAITGNPTKAGVYTFTIKATDGGLTATLAYEITITVQGPPDQLLCDPADNGGFLISGSCVLTDAVIGLPYQGHLVTSHKAGGALSVVSGSLPPGLSLPATFTGSGDTVGGTPTDPGVEPGRNFTVQGTGDQGQPCTRPTRST
jgi:hypothetical protein